jgi:hypothetical protein
LFLLDGRFACVLEPGRHDLGGMIKRGIDLRARYEATAVVYDSSEFSLSFGEIKALTKENVEIHAQCELRLRVEDAAKLFTNVAKGADVLRRVDLMLFLAPEVANGLGEAIRPHGVQVFRESYSMKRDLEQALMNHLSRTLEHTGLGVGYLRVFNVRQERLDAQNRKIAEYFFQATDMTVESDGRRQLLGARQDLLGVERAEVAQQADHLRQSLEPRLAFLSATRNLQAADWENENLMAELRRQYDRAGFARELSFEQFQQEARLNSVQALRTLQERLDQDYRKLTKINEVEMVRLTGDVSVARIEQEQRGINTQFDAELGRQGRGADFNRTQRQLEVDTDLGIKRKEFDANTDMRRVEVDTLRQEAALSMDNLERLKAIERNDQLALQGGLVDLRLREQKARVELEIQTFQALKDMPQETILAIKSPEHLAQVLQKRAGADVAERFYALQAEQQTAFVAHMQQMMSAAMAQNAKVAETAAQRPASVVFGPAFSSPTTIQPPVVQPTIVQPPDQNAS